MQHPSRQIFHHYEEMAEEKRFSVSKVAGRRGELPTVMMTSFTDPLSCQIFVEQEFPKYKKGRSLSLSLRVEVNWISVD